MTDARLHTLVTQAAARGVLPDDAVVPEIESRPWPVVLLTALGAWLAALPLIGMVGLMLGDLVSRGAGPYIIGPLVLTGAVIVLRARDVPLFVEQLAVPGLLVGGGALAFGLFRDLHLQAGAGVLALVALGVATVLPRAWLRVLLGAAAAALVMVACTPERSFERGARVAFGIAVHVAFAAWLLAIATQERVQHDVRLARIAATLESVGAGWLLATLAALAWWSGMTFLVGASAGGSIAGEIAREVVRAASPQRGFVVLQAVSVLLAGVAAARLAATWPAVRRAWCAGVAVGLLVLAWFMPALGAVLLAIALCACGHRWRLATAGALAAAWIAGAFYYALAWPLATKAIVLVAAGAWLGAMARWGWRDDARPASRADASAKPPRAVLAGIAASALATLAVVNVGIWQKQSLIESGQAVFIRIAPVDPRSLMQGDYMRLDFSVPSDVQRDRDLTSERPRVVARRDDRGVATLLRRDAGAPLAPGEFLIELTPKNGQWTVVTDAWFFAEGEAERLAKARYGEFRVDAKGRALLVGLRGAQLETL